MWIYAALKGKPGVYPYRCDNGDFGHREFSLAVFVETADLKRKVLAISKAIGLAVDPASSEPQDKRILEWKLNQVLHGTYEGQIS